MAQCRRTVTSEPKDEGHSCVEQGNDLNWDEAQLQECGNRQMQMQTHQTCVTVVVHQLMQRSHLTPSHGQKL